jgi:CDP-diacylglycerol--serine O-phosphatidyltransferase
VKRPQMKNGLKKIWMWYRHIPTALTLCNSLCGFAAILNTLRVYEPNANIPEVLAGSAWLIVGAMIFDMLDGWVARLLNAFSDHGMNMDSLADMVTFGVAPAVMIAVLAQTAELLLPYRLVWVLCAIYLGCAAIRLALYNVKALNKESTEGFDGLPSPGAAAALVTLIILFADAQSETYITLVQWLPIYAGVIGLLMVSSIPFLHFGRWLGSKRYNKAKVLALIVFFLFFSWNSRLVAAVAANLYVLSGPIAVGIRWIIARVRRERPAAIAETPAEAAVGGK